MSDVAFEIRSAIAAYLASQLADVTVLADWPAAGVELDPLTVSVSSEDAAREEHFGTEVRTTTPKTATTGDVELAHGRFELALQLDVFAPTPGELGALLDRLRPTLHRHPAATLAADTDVLDAGDGLVLDVPALHTRCAIEWGNTQRDLREPLAADFRATISGTADGLLVLVREMPLQKTTIVTVAADDGPSDTLTIEG